jgi:hypothetical protein
MLRRLVTVLLVGCVVPGTALAGVSRITSDMDHIEAQEVMDQAVYGDTVLVAPGEYKMIYVRNGIHLLGEEGPEKTLFSWTGEVVVANETDSATVIEGISADGGKGSPGVIVVEHSKARIKNCIIRNGSAGIRSTFAEPVIENCRISRCHTGVYLYETDAVISGSDIQRCWRGISVVNSDPRIERCTFTVNSLAIFVSEYSVPIIGGSLEAANRFLDNPGGAIRNEARLKKDGIRYEKLAIVRAPYNYWGTNCPDASLFRGDVVYEPWVDETGTRSLTVCEEPQTEPE